MDTTTRYAWLFTLTRALRTEGGDPRPLIQRGLGMIAEAVDAPAACVVLIEGLHGLHDLMTVGMEPSTVNMTDDVWTRQVQRGLVGFVQHSQRVVNVRDLRTDPRWPNAGESGPLPVSGSAIGLPLAAPHPAGVLMLMHPQAEYFNDEHVTLLRDAALLLAETVVHATRWQQAEVEAAHYRRLYEQGVAPCLITNFDGLILDSNPQADRLIGVEPGQLLGQSLQELLPVTMPPQEDTEWLLPLNIENQTVLTIQVRARRLRLPNNELLAWTLLDASAANRLHQFQHDLSAMVYHDLRGMVMNVHASLTQQRQLLKGDQSPEYHVFSRLAMRSADKMSLMVKTLLDIERLENHQLPLRRNPTVLPVLLADAAEMVYAVTDNETQRLVFEIQDDLPLLQIDADMIQRVITNLVDNAVKYTPPHGEIVISARLIEEGVRVTVSDSGPGIPDAMREQIFDKYVRLQNRNAPVGVGLGLAFCKMAIEAHGGRIWVESGPGTRFHFMLPLQGQAAQVLA